MTLPLRRSSDKWVVVGFDPSLRHWGMAKGILAPSTMELTVHHLDVFEPIISTDAKMRTNTKDLEAAEQLAKSATDAAQGADAIFVEVPHGSKSARAMVSYGVCLGVLGALRAKGIPFFQVSESEVKLATTGNKQATKHDTIKWAMDKHPEAPWPMRNSKGVPVVVSSTAEHMADAIGAIYAGLASKPFQQLLPLIRPWTA